MLIKIKENTDKQALSHSDHINDMLGAVEEVIAEKTAKTYTVQICLC